MHNISKSKLDEVYLRYNKPEFISPDPLQFLYNYDNKADREIVGLIAAGLAYGRVAQIIRDVERVLKTFGKNPAAYLKNTSNNEIKTSLKGFKHRFTTDDEMSSLIIGIKNVLKNYGSLQNLFLEKYKANDDDNILPALTHFVLGLKKSAGIKKSTILSEPEMGSACKRLNLFLRWMVRYDKVDPGGWDNISTSKLIIPLDTHMFYFGKCYGFTKRKAADLKTAVEITSGFKVLCPADPVKYDFALTRFGIRNDMCWQNFNDIKVLKNEAARHL